MKFVYMIVFDLIFLILICQKKNNKKRIEQKQTWTIKSLYLLIENYKN